MSEQSDTAINVVIGNYAGTTIAKINPSGTQIILTTYVDTSQVPDFNLDWLQRVYASPSYTVIYEPPAGFEPDLPRRGAPKKRQE